MAAALTADVADNRLEHQPKLEVPLGFCRSGWTHEERFDPVNDLEWLDAAQAEA